MSEPVANSSDPLELVGTLIDERYQVERLIGRGGMGYVYEATHTRIQRPVAIKVLSQLTARRRFEREALTTARLEHPNCVRLTDFGNLEDGTLFLVMELLHGVSLASVIDDHGAMNPPRALRIARDVLSALAHAHELGVVHRDIKPENIYLCRDSSGEELAKVLDFGIAKLISDATAGDEENLTEAGMAIGTPTYMSPEQGFGSGIDGRSDVYSTTVVLFEMLTGKPPFRAESPLDTLRLHISEPPPTLRSRAASLDPPAELEALIADGLAKKSAERIESAKAFIARLDALLEGGTIGATTDAAEVEAKEPPARAESAPPAPTTNISGPSSAVSLSPSLEMAAAVSSTAPVATVGATETTSSPAPRWKQRKVLVAIGAALALVGILMIVSAGSSGTSAKGSAHALKWLPVETPPPPVPTSSPLASKAAELLDAKKAREAIAMLGDDPGAQDDASALVVLGHAYATIKKPAPALRAYAAALEKESAFGGEETLLSNLKSYLGSRRRSTISDALDCLTIAAEPHNNRQARRAFADVASSHPKRDIRKRAQEIAETLDIDAIDWLAAHSLDLRQGKSCKERLAAVNKLRELGDKKAIPTLRKAQRRMGGGFLGIGKKNINNCLKNAVAEAIAELEER